MGENSPNEDLHLNHTEFRLDWNKKVKVYNKLWSAKQREDVVSSGKRTEDT